MGIEVLAITDHDTVAGVPAALAEAERLGVTLIPGVEISTLSGREELHLLGYFVDPGNEELQTLLARTQEAREERAKKMLLRLADMGLSIEWDQVVESARGSVSIGRPHLAATMVGAGFVSSFNEAFALWIGRGCPAYVERRKLSPEDAIQLVRRSGGLPVLAHPYIYSRQGRSKGGLDLRRWLPRLREAGLEGIEAYYPHYARRVNRHLLTMAIKHDLVITGGSDYHGGVLGNGLGSIAVPWAAWEGLRRRHRLLQIQSRRNLQTAYKRQPASFPVG